MSVLKVTRTKAASKHLENAHAAATVTIGTGSDPVYNTSHKTEQRSPAATGTFNDANLIVLTVNPKLNKEASTAKPNAKAEAAKQMFLNYRNKK